MVISKPASDSLSISMRIIFLTAAGD